MANKQANTEVFWAEVTVNNRITIPPVICKIAGVNETKIVKLQLLAVENKEA